MDDDGIVIENISEDDESVDESTVDVILDGNSKEELDEISNDMTDDEVSEIISEVETEIGDEVEVELELEDDDGLADLVLLLDSPAFAPSGN